MDRHEREEAQSKLLREALLARADAEAAQVRADDARAEAEEARADAEEARAEAELGRSRIWFLAEAGRQMAASIDWEATLEAVVRSAVPTVADWTALTIFDGRRLNVVAVAHSHPARDRLAAEYVRHAGDFDRPPAVADAIRTGKVQLVEDLSPERLGAIARVPRQRHLLEELGVRHYATAPLTSPSGPIGAWTFVLGDSGRRFTPEDIQLIGSLAARAALHVQNARLYTERAHTVEVLQASLLPRKLPAIPGAELAARFRPAGDHVGVGGDFYDVYPSHEGVWTAILGDVVGKGPEAAATTALARHTLRTASLLSADPAANLALLNRALHADSIKSRHCTACYLRVRPDEHGFECLLANAGHPAPLIRRGDGTVEAPDARGPLLGAFPDPHYDAAHFRLETGELLLMYTDGITDVRPGSAEEREHTLHRILAECVSCSADQVVEAVLTNAVESQQPGKPTDDIALLAMKALGAGRGSTNGSAGDERP